MKKVVFITFLLLPGLMLWGQNTDPKGKTKKEIALEIRPNSRDYAPVRKTNLHELSAKRKKGSMMSVKRKVVVNKIQPGDLMLRPNSREYTPIKRNNRHQSIIQAKSKMYRRYVTNARRQRMQRIRVTMQRRQQLIERRQEMQRRKMIQEQRIRKR